MNYSWLPCATVKSWTLRLVVRRPLLYRVHHFKLLLSTQLRHIETSWLRAHLALYASVAGASVIHWQDEFFLYLIQWAWGLTCICWRFTGNVSGADVVSWFSFSASRQWRSRGPRSWHYDDVSRRNVRWTCFWKEKATSQKKYWLRYFFPELSRSLFSMARAVLSGEGP